MTTFRLDSRDVTPCLALETLRFALKLAREFDVPMPMAAAGEQILIEAMARGWGDRDSTSPWELHEEPARVQVRATKPGASSSP